MHHLIILWHLSYTIKKITLGKYICVFVCVCVFQGHFFSFSAVETINLQQERIPNPSPLGREQHEEQTDHEPDDEWERVDESTLQNQTITAQNIMVQQGKGKKGNGGK